MTEPKRWSSPQSEVDPVLRSVLLYGRNLSPDSQQLQAILRGAEARRSTALKWLPIPPTPLSFTHPVTATR